MTPRGSLDLGSRGPAVATDPWRTPAWIWYVAAATVLVRLAGVWPPLRPDEAGFLLVARSWDPEPGSMYGQYLARAESSR